MTQRRFSMRNLKHGSKSRDIPKERNDELQKCARQAAHEINRASDIGSFLLSAGALKILARYNAEEAELVSKYETFDEYIAAASWLADRYLKEFIAEARKDLKR